MKLDCVLTSVNENELYIDFIPLFVKTWNKLYPNVDVKIILIANNIPDKFKEYKDNIILFEPIENVLTSFTSQYIRLLYPCILKYKNGIMITDIDMLPMNKTYYTESIKPYDNNKFIYLRENLLSYKKQIAICYNVASPHIWQEIFQISSLNDIINRLKSIFQNNTIIEGHANKGWSIDQKKLYKKVMKWNVKTNNFIRMKEKIFHRLDRIKKWDINDKNERDRISNNFYIDYHCLRPMSKYYEINNTIYDLL